MFDHLWFIIPGVIVGTIAGFMPGIGRFASMMLLLPFLFQITPIELLTFFIAMTSLTQYVGSVSATVFALPGEASSLPAVKEGHALYRQGQGAMAISGAAIGSFVGSFLVLILVSFFIPELQDLYKVFEIKVQTLVLFGVAFLICITSKSFWPSVIFAFFGYLLGLVGCQSIDHYCFATFGNPDLTTGLPLISVVSALYVFPQLIKKYEFNPNAKVMLQTEQFVTHLKKYFKSFNSSLRGTVIGFFAGFTPGISEAVSSNVSYNVEKWLERKKGTYKLGNYNCLIAAETANNAGAFTAFLPLLVFGIPLTASDAVFYDLMMTKGFILGQGFDANFFLWNLAIVLCITNFAALCVAWPMAKYVCYLQKIPERAFKISIFIFLICAIYYSGTFSWQEEYYLITFLALLPLGYVLRKFDTLPMIFCFIIQDRLYVIISRWNDILFN